jgi:peptidoglycan/xylan/chitin deacetylase (PgdA/CDA1 family)
MVRTLKPLIYRLCQIVGLFAVARFVTRRGLRILCYHGFSLADEDAFRPGLFIRAETFERRLRFLSKHRYPVVTLQQAADGLDAGTLPSSAVVITIDDGFFGVGSVAGPILKRHGFPATLYVTSYYVAKTTPVFRLAIQYMFWKTTAASLDASGLGLPVPQTIPLQGEGAERRMWEIIRFGETELDEPRRVALGEALGQRLGVPYGPLAASRCYSLMTDDELRRLASSGIDIQLHTHRHHLPEDQALVEREIVENRSLLEPIGATPLTHFCYPSGIWSKRHWPWLEALG